VSGAGQRRLAAILAADVVGYSRLMGADEDATLTRVQALFRELAAPAVAAQGGRIFKQNGDAFLAEFPSAVGAVACAEAVQRALAGREAGAAEPLRLRIGVHLGDVVALEGDLFGDGVNIAARLEAVAEPGGVALSAAVAEAVRGKLPFPLIDAGEQALKNIARPVRVFRLGVAGAPAEPAAPALPDKPSLAVLPFQNLSGDAEQDYFADGMVEDITTALSRIRWLFVIARNSAFTYKGRAVDVRQVGRELGVRYVLEGSVRRAGGRVRINTQLIEAASGAHLWAERFDGALDDVFELQDRVTEAVAGAIEPSLQRAEVERAQRKPTESLDAYDLYLRACPHELPRRLEEYRQRVDLLLRACAMDPGFAQARALAALLLAEAEHQGWGTPEEHAAAVPLAREALDTAGEHSAALRWAAQALVLMGVDQPRAHAAMARAMALNPNSALTRGGAGWLEVYGGTPEAALEHFRQAMRLSPLDPDLARFHTGAAMAWLRLRRWEEALAEGERAVALRPDRAVGYRVAMTALHQLGRPAERDAMAARFRAAAPSAARVLAARVERIFADKAHGAAIIAALRAAGLPE
jgi:adenylate cyclase